MSGYPATIKVKILYQITDDTLFVRIVFPHAGDEEQHMVEALVVEILDEQELALALDGSSQVDDEHTYVFLTVKPEEDQEAEDHSTTMANYHLFIGTLAEKLPDTSSSRLYEVIGTVEQQDVTSEEG